MLNQRFLRNNEFSTNHPVRSGNLWPIAVARIFIRASAPLKDEKLARLFIFGIILSQSEKAVFYHLSLNVQFFLVIPAKAGLELKLQRYPEDFSMCLGSAKASIQARVSAPLQPE